MKTQHLSAKEKLFLIECIQNGEEIPVDFQYKLFPTLQKEYELVYAGKMKAEDILSDKDGVSAANLKIDKVFHLNDKLPTDNWKNMVVLGDNLQFLKTIYKNEDPLIKDKVKGKIKLIYIDPPFATEANFKGKKGQKAYSDKSKDSDFIEFLRRRLVVAREILAEDGNILVHTDSKKGQYIKLVLDEIFGEKMFQNEIIWHYEKWTSPSISSFQKNHDVIYFYSKSGQNQFNIIKEITENLKGKYAKGYLIGGGQGSKGLVVYDEKNPKVQELIRSGKYDVVYAEAKGKPLSDVWKIPFINPVAKERTGYPTQKPEKLMARIIESLTQPKDLILDFFGGSGTTAAVAEKMNRRWMTCDIGKLSVHTIQKRMLSIQNTKDLNRPSKKHNQQAKPFITLKTHPSPSALLLDLPKERYIDFVMSLFNIAPNISSINEVEINGTTPHQKPVLIWKYWEHENKTINEAFIKKLHQSFKGYDDKVYIIAPSYCVESGSDYYEMEGVRYCLLKVPYPIILKLHEITFEQFRNPTSKTNPKALEEAVSFYFTHQPQVVSSFQNGELHLHDFKTAQPDAVSKKGSQGFKTLSMIMIDNDYNSENWAIAEVYFAENLLPKNTPNVSISLKKYAIVLGLST